jgi:hypothetical protein
MLLCTAAQPANGDGPAPGPNIIGGINQHTADDDDDLPGPGIVGGNNQQHNLSRGMLR